MGRILKNVFVEAIFMELLSITSLHVLFSHFT